MGREKKLLKRLNAIDLSMQKLDTLAFEKQARLQGYRKIAGVDEAGRGPLAGPLVVAACSLPEGVFIEGVNDSKKLSEKQRKHLYHLLTSHPLIDYAIEMLDAKLVDELNIFQATLQGMQLAVSKLQTAVDYVLVDGNHTPSFPVPSLAIVQGDFLSHSIACASILAKVTRDAWMTQAEVMWPGYGFAKHKGYPTKSHKEALQKLGPSPIHRMSYRPVAILRK